MNQKQTTAKDSPKPKKAHVPNPPRLPAGLASLVPNAGRPKKR
jgi:hypothetical protein